MSGKKVSRRWENTLWYAMEKRKISAAEIQFRCKGLVSRSTVDRIRRKQYVPNIEIAFHIAQAIGKPIEWVFYNTEGFHAAQNTGQDTRRSSPGTDQTDSVGGNSDRRGQS